METRDTDWLLVFALWLAGIGAAAQFGKIAVLFAPLTQIYGSGVAVMVTVVGLTGLVFGTTAGLIVGRIGFRRVLVTCLSLGAVLSLIQAPMLPWPVMMLTRMAEGVSHLGIVVAAPVMIVQAAAPRHHGAVMALWSSFFGISFALLAFLGLPLALALGPSSLFVAHGLYMAVMAAILFRLARPVRSAAAPEAANTAAHAAIGPAPGFLQRHIDLYRSPYVAAPGLGFVFYTAMFVAILTILPGMASGRTALRLATFLPLVATGVSLTLAVWLLGRFHPVRLVQVSYAAAALVAALLWAGWPGSALIGGLCLSAALGLAQSSNFATIPALNASPEDRASAAGAIAQMGNLGTVSGTPILAAMTGAWGISGLLAFVLPLSLGGIAMLTWLARRRARIPPALI